ncbi:MAG: hypothetical protein NZ455_08880 [Bacteroidia bacterium]|nr:hypothetical protein [Bacteroidia bacterium]
MGRSTVSPQHADLAHMSISETCARTRPIQLIAINYLTRILMVQGHKSYLQRYSLFCFACT